MYRREGIKGGLLITIMILDSQGPHKGWLGGGRGEQSAPRESSLIVN